MKRICLSITTNTGWQRKNKEKWGFLWFFARLFVSLQHQDKNDMIATGQTTTNQKAKATTTRERVMASTVSVDEYFDELISQVHQDYAEL